METIDGAKYTRRGFEIDCVLPAENGTSEFPLPVRVDMYVRRGKNEGSLEVKADANLPWYDTLGSASYKRGKKQLKLDDSFPAARGQPFTTAQELADELASGIVKDYRGSPASVRYFLNEDNFESNLRESLRRGLEELIADKSKYAVGEPTADEVEKLKDYVGCAMLVGV